MFPGVTLPPDTPPVHLRTYEDLKAPPLAKAKMLTAHFINGANAERVKIQTWSCD